MKLKTRIFGILLTIALCAFVYAHAATRYVSHSGSNTFPYTTWETAANTIEAANLATLPRDTMLVDTGSFYQVSRIFTQPRITVLGQGMDHTTVLGADTGSVFYTMFMPEDSNTIENIHFVGHGSAYAFGKYATDPHRSFFCRRCKFSNFTSSILNFDNNREIEVRDCWFESWYVSALSFTGPGDYSVVNNTFYAPDRWRQICDFMNNSSGHIVFDSNVVVGCGAPGINGVGGGGFEMKYNLFYGKSFLGEVVYGADDFEVAFNSFYIDLPTNFSGADILTIVGTSLRRSHIYNNIFAGWKPHVIFYFDVSDSADIRVNYNCFYSTEPMLEANIGIVSGTGTIDSAYGNVYADPMFVDPDNGDLRLQKGSPCIDAGAPWILDPDGSRSDIGAFGGPGGSVYIYQDYPPNAPASMTAWRGRDRVILSWERNSESDFLHYVLFRSTAPDSPLDSEYVLTYLDRLGRPIRTDNRKRPFFFGDDGKQFDPEQYIPMYIVKDLRRVYCVDWYPVDTLASYYTLVAIDSSGLVSSASTATVAATIPSGIGDCCQEGIPDSASLEPNYPNPFNATTALVYNLPAIGAQPAPVHIEVFNILGQRVKTLVDTRQSPGRHTIYWDGTDEQGKPLSSGVYFCRLEVSGIEFVKSGKMMLMK